MQIDFTKAQRESPVVIILILFKSIFSLGRQFALPFITIYFLGKKDNESTYLLPFIIFITVISMIRSLISFFRKKFYIDEDELIVMSGALSNKTISIPFERIQSINFEQNVIHRILKVVKLKIDTAGSKDKEAEIDGLNLQKAEALRTLLLKEKDEALAKQDSEEIQDEDTDAEVAATIDEKIGKPIITLSLKDLIKASLFENHLNSLAIIFASFWYIYINAREVGINAEDYVDKIPIIYDITMYALVILATAIIAIIISLFRTSINYYKLTFVRVANGFRIQKGLFNYITLSALDHKIQTFGWSDTWLKKKIGIHDIRMKQASISKVETKESIVVPGASIDHVKEVIQNLYPHSNVDAISMRGVHPSYLNRRIAITLGVLFIISCIATYFEIDKLFYFTIVMMFVLPFMYTKRFRKLAFGYDREFLRLRGGTFGDSHIIMPIYKIQSVKQHQSPFQRKRGLVSLSIHNASGSETIPYIYEKEAHSIMDYFLYKAEVDNRTWI
jgi:putative membrane protein